MTDADTTDTVTLTGPDVAFIADALDLAGRFLTRAHIHDAGSLRGVAGLTRHAAGLLRPSGLGTITDHEQDESPLI